MYEEGGVDDALYNLVCGPSRVVTRYDGYIVNGFRFHSMDRSENRKTQNCGVIVRGDDESDKEYYGVVKDIYEVHYPGDNHVFLFKCNWFDVANHGRGYKVDDNGFISVNKTRSLKSDEVFVLESQVEQVFYIQHPHKEDWQFVVKAQPRDLYDMPSDDSNNQVIDVDAYQQGEIGCDGNVNSNVYGDFLVSSLATGQFRTERGVNIIKMFRKLTEEHVEDDDFINDGEIELHEESFEEDEFDSDS